MKQEKHYEQHHRHPGALNREQSIYKGTRDIYQLTTLRKANKNSHVVVKGVRSSVRCNEKSKEADGNWTSQAA